MTSEQTLMVVLAGLNTFLFSTGLLNKRGWLEKVSMAASLTAAVVCSLKLIVISLQVAL